MMSLYEVMSMYDWNMSIRYGQDLCESLKNEGYYVRLKAYKQGLCMEVYDFMSGKFKKYYSGVHQTFRRMGISLFLISERIKRDKVG